MKIIIVEKNIDSAKTIESQLKFHSDQIHIFKHGFFAIQAMKKIRYDIAILNHDIGVESGFMIARYLRKFNPKLKVIIFSKNKVHFYKQIRAIREDYHLIEQACFHESSANFLI